MDAEQQRRINETAERLGNAMKESYRAAVAERGVSAQELNAQLAQDFFNKVGRFCYSAGSPSKRMRLLASLFGTSICCSRSQHGTGAITPL